jgi:hypothetical protein
MGDVHEQTQDIDCEFQLQRLIQLGHGESRDDSLYDRNSRAWIRQCLYDAAANFLDAHTGSGQHLRCFAVQPASCKRAYSADTRHRLASEGLVYDIAY